MGSGIGLGAFLRSNVDLRMDMTDKRYLEINWHKNLLEICYAVFFCQAKLRVGVTLRAENALIKHDFEAL